MKQPFEEGHAPEGTYPRSPWTEPTFGTGLGSCVPSFAVVIGLTTDDRRLIFPRTTHKHQSLNGDLLP